MNARYRKTLFGLTLSIGMLLSCMALHAETALESVGATVGTGDCCVPICCPDQCGADCPDQCPAAPRFWFQPDYLLWWVSKGPVSTPLVVTGSSADAIPGGIGQPGTRVLFGDQNLNYGTFSGLRLSTGFWIDPDSIFAVEGSGFALEHRSVHFSAEGNAQGQPYLAQPFYDVLRQSESVYYISQNFTNNPIQQANLTGGIFVASNTRLWGWEVNSSARLIRNTAWSLDVLLGYRRLDLKEDLGLSNTATSLVAGFGDQNLFAGTTINPPYSVSILDSFSTRNSFNGGQVGSRFAYHWGRLSLELLGKVALGSMQEVVTINGVTTTNAPLAVTSLPGGIFAQASNIGQYHRDVFAVVPEGNLNLGVQITNWLSARVGYTFLYASNVVRPGDQIDRTINTNLVPIDTGYGTPGGPARPGFSFKDTDFWAQGLNLGLQLQF
jgi:hypothetical protein